MSRSKVLKAGDHIFTSRYYAKALGLADKPLLFEVGLQIEQVVQGDDGQMHYKIKDWKWLTQSNIDAWFKTTSRVEPEEERPTSCPPGYEP